MFYYIRYTFNSTTMQQTEVSEATNIPYELHLTSTKIMTFLPERHIFHKCVIQNYIKIAPFYKLSKTKQDKHCENLKHLL